MFSCVGCRHESIHSVEREGIPLSFDVFIRLVTIHCDCRLQHRRRGTYHFGHFLFLPDLLSYENAFTSKDFAIFSRHEDGSPGHACGEDSLRPNLKPESSLCVQNFTFLVRSCAGRVPLPCCPSGLSGSTLPGNVQ